jgi:hypothetical protein
MLRLHALAAWNGSLAASLSLLAVGTRWRFMVGFKVPFA